MIAAAAPLAIAGNVARITVVIITAEAFGHDAGKRIEQKLGFVTFVVALLGVFILGWLLRDRTPQPELVKGRSDGRSA